MGYLEVDPGGAGASHRLSRFYEREAQALEGFVFADAGSDRELWPALKRFFAKDEVEAAIR